jgi:hypothetical protein
MIDQAQLLRGVDAEAAHEVRHVLPVGPPCAGTLLAGEPDVFLGDRGQGVETVDLAEARDPGDEAGSG